MCVYTKQKSGTVLVPLEKVSLYRKDSQVWYSSEEPDCYYYYDSMHYYFLHPTLADWFVENNGTYKLYYCVITGKWVIEIDDLSLSILFKLTFE